MSARLLSAYASVRTEGALLPADILARIAAGDTSFGGLDPASYHLDPSEKIGEATNRAWNRLQARWATFQTERAKLAPTDTGTSITRERWLLPLFEELKFGRLQLATKIEIDGKSYAVSHSWQHVPIHLVGCQVDLDRRVVVAGAQRSSPHSLLQELLNRSSGHLWGVVSNGLRLRLLRDNISLTRQAYVEFDLEAMMAGEAYPDFVLLWLILHQSRFEGERPEFCQLEKWSQAARTEGVRVLDGLRDGVQKAIEYLGQGFLAHPSNAALREKLRSGALDKQDYYRQLLRLVYRLLFLFVAEDRDLLVVPTADPAAQKRYRNHYATTRLRRLATTRAGSRHHDLYCGLRLVMDKLSGNGCPELALPALGSFLFSAGALPDLNTCDISNLHLLESIRSLAVTQTGQSRRVVDYKNLGAEELGSVYESLLELHPDLNAEAATFELKVAAGSERKKTGSYYTPTSLISCLLDSALNPVLDEAARQAEPEAAILKLKVVDPACGSGHFLIAAAHRIAKRLAAVRTGEEEPPPEAQRKALRDVIGHCIYGVDVNPMAVELCKVSLWMEAIEPGKPLSFLEHRVQCGNSLLGATPALLAQGIPDEAFTPIEGDVKEICKEFKRINRDERNKQMRLFAATTEPWQQLGNFAASLMNLDTVGDDSIESIREKERMYEAAMRSGDYLDGRFWADTWCAAFVWKKTREFSYPITEEVFRRIERNPHACEPWMRSEIRRLADEYRFFHWHLAFPDVFRLPPAGEYPRDVLSGWTGGFDVVLGNPPWERVKLQEKEWFATRRPDIVAAGNASIRRRMIQALKDDDPHMFEAFRSAIRKADAESALIRSTGRFPLCGKGDVNTYAVFTENNRTLTDLRGRVGCIVPSGIATDESTSEFFGDLVEKGQLASLFDFENRENLFPGVGHGRMKFTLITIGIADEARFAFQLWNTGQMSEPGRMFSLSPEDISSINPNTRTCPIFRTERDANLTKAVYARVPVLVREVSPPANPWNVSFSTMLHMGNDAHLFRTEVEMSPLGYTLVGNSLEAPTGNVFVPLYEAKMANHFDHRFGTYEGRTESQESTALNRLTLHQKMDPHCLPMPRFWVDEREIPNISWFLACRKITHATNDRTFICHILPRSGAGDSLTLILPEERHAVLYLAANLSSFVFDYIARQKVGGLNLNNFIIKQLPVLPPDAYQNSVCVQEPGFIENRVLELVYTSWDLRRFANDMDFPGAPFIWNESRRIVMRCELDALYLHLYAISRGDAGYILDTFPIIREREISEHGEYRTKRVILEIYDAMAEAQRTGVPYQTRVDPPPADPRVAHAQVL